MIPDHAFTALVSQGYVLLNHKGPYVFAVKQIGCSDRYVLLKYVDDHFQIIFQ
jgi:hypothetical protein